MTMGGERCVCVCVRVRACMCACVRVSACSVGGHCTEQEGPVYLEDCLSYPPPPRIYLSPQTHPFILHPGQVNFRLSCDLSPTPPLPPAPPTHTLTPTWTPPSLPPSTHPPPPGSTLTSVPLRRSGRRSSCTWCTAPVGKPGEGSKVTPGWFGGVRVMPGFPLKGIQQWHEVELNYSKTLLLNCNIFIIDIGEILWESSNVVLYYRRVKNT